MNKSELLARLEGQLGSHRAAAAALDSVLGEITTAVAAGERVTLTGFGTFERVERPARTGRNPRTGDPLEIGPSAAPRFHPGAALRAAVAGTAVGTAAGATRAAPPTTPPSSRGSRAAAASAPSGTVRRVRSAVRRTAEPVTQPPSSSLEIAAPDEAVTQAKHGKHHKPAKPAASGKKSAKSAKASAGKKKKK